MRGTVIFSILIGLYIFSTVCSYKYTKVAYSKGGIWGGLKPDTANLFFTFTPIANFFVAIEYLLGNCYEKKEKNILNKFYRINK